MPPILVGGIITGLEKTYFQSTGFSVPGLRYVLRPSTNTGP